MEHIIENDYLKVKVADFGAEIRSVIRKADDREMMWQADSAFWGRTSPVLFPLVGNYYEKKSEYNGQIYEMGQHGFARDMEFICLDEKHDEITFELISSDKTYEKYPFDFSLVINYVLKDSTVQVNWKVKNEDSEIMYFSIGAHPAFNCDLNNSSLLFEKGDEKCDEIIANVIASDGSGCLSDEQDRYELNDGLLKMLDDLFSKDALVVEKQQADRVTLIDENGEVLVAVTCPTPLFGIWSPVGKHAPFVCIEPWYGRCDRVGFNQKLQDREYGNQLEAGKVFHAGYEMIF